MYYVIPDVIGPTASAGNVKCGKYSSLAEMSILDLAPVIAGSVEDRISWFQQRSLLANRLNCPACGAAMQMQTRNDIQDKRRYFCNICIVKNNYMAGI